MISLDLIALSANSLAVDMRILSRLALATEFDDPVAKLLTINNAEPTAIMDKKHFTSIWKETVIRNDGICIGAQCYISMGPLITCVLAVNNFTKNLRTTSHIIKN